MRIVLQVILTIEIIVLCVCVHFARRSDKPMARSVALLIASLIPAILGNVIIIGAVSRPVAVIGMYIYFIGMDLIMACLLKFTLDYCYYSWDNKVLINFVYSLLGIDIIQLLLNPFFGHAFAAEELEAGGLPYFRVVPYAGQIYHRVIVYGFLLASIILFIIKRIRSSRIYRERYTTMLASMIFTSVWESFYILSGTPVDTSMIGFGIFGVLVFYFALYYKPVILISSMLESIASGLNDALFFFNEEKACIWANKKGLDFFRIRENETDKVNKKLLTAFPEMMSAGDEWVSDHISGSRDSRKYYHIEKHIAKDNDDKRRTIGFFVSIRDNTEAQKNLEKERYIARHDSLTGLYNKETLYRMIPELIKAHPDGPYQIIFVDINEFKLVNDVFGKDFGDYALRYISGWIREDMTENCVYGRLGGDTFGICMPVSEFDPEAINERIDSLVVRMGEKEHHLLVHLGIYPVEDPELEVSIMFDRARMALNKIKRIYSHISYYNDQIRDEMLWNQQISAELTNAIKDGQIVPFLQPIVNAKSELVGAEALVRWLHPEKGNLSPALFIPEFERNGKIAEIDKHMWRCAGEILKSWRHSHPELFLSVNISSMDFYFMDIRSELNDIVRECGIDAEKLRLEITETVMMNNSEERLETVRQLRSDGFIVEIDDFGSGYSSLNMLKDMPVDLIKLDMAFLQNSKGNERAKIILRSLIDLVDTLGMDSLTEGVETKKQFEVLADY
ncbi:MAG: EAL domain-containing protein, partial [Mogibacterium sp.]|nr:EAL domain-containing protein [Mogibacterium sp.]